MIAVLANSRRQYDDFLRPIINRKDFFYANQESIIGRDITGYIDIAYEKDLEQSTTFNTVELKTVQFQDSIKNLVESKQRANKKYLSLKAQVEKLPKILKWWYKLKF